jgi:hypothetical protein
VKGGPHIHPCANCGTSFEHDNPYCIDDEMECDRCYEELKEYEDNKSRRLAAAASGRRN